MISPGIGVKIKNVWNHHLEVDHFLEKSCVQHLAALSSVRSTKLRTDFTRDNAIYRLQPSFCMRYAITKVALLYKKIRSEISLLKQPRCQVTMTSWLLMDFSEQKTTGINQESRSGCLIGVWPSINVNFQAVLIGNHDWPQIYLVTFQLRTLLRQVLWTKTLVPKKKVKKTIEPIITSCFFQVVPNHPVNPPVLSFKTMD